MPGAYRDLTINIHERREGNALTEAARDLERLSRGSDVARLKFEEMARDARKLDAEIVRTKGRIGELTTMFARTGDRSLFGDLRKERNYLRDLERLAAQISRTASTALNAGIKTGLSLENAFPPHVKAALVASLVGIGAAAAPAVGAMIGGAVAGIGALGGVAGGIVSAIHDERVKAAAADFGKSFSDQFFIGSQFVPATVQALQELASAVKDMQIVSTLEKVAQFVPDLAKGIGDLGRNFMSGFGAALDHAGPLIETLALRLPDLGDALGKFLDDVSGGEGAIAGLNALFSATDNVITRVGQGIRGLEDAFASMLRFESAAGGKLQSFFTTLDKLTTVAGVHINPLFGMMAGGFRQMKEQADGVTAGMDNAKSAAQKAFVAATFFAGATETTADAVKRLRLEFEAQSRAAHDLASGQIEAGQSLDDLKKSLQENGRAWGVNTQAGRDNERAVLAGVDAAKRMRDAMIESGVNTATANILYQEQIDRLVEMAVKYGLNEEAVSNFITELAKVPPVTTAQLLLEFGAKTGMPIPENSGLRRNELAGGGPISPDQVGGSETGGGRTAEQNGTPIYEPTYFFSGGPVGFRARGGPVDAGQTYVVGEHGKELLRMGSQSGYVSPMSTMGGGALELVIRSGGSAMDDLLVQILSKAVQVRGGDGAVLGIRTVSGR